MFRTVPLQSSRILVVRGFRDPAQVQEQFVNVHGARGNGCARRLIVKSEQPMESAGCLQRFAIATGDDRQS